MFIKGNVKMKKEFEKKIKKFWMTKEFHESEC